MFLLEFFEKIYSYLEETISLRDLEDWLVPRLPLLFSLPKSSMTDLISTIELGLAEMSSGTLSEEEFRNRVWDYLRTLQTVTFHLEAQQTPSTGASSKLSQSVLRSDEIPMEVEEIPV